MGLVLYNEKGNQRLVIDRSPFLFGRSVHADHVESQPEINRRHALFCYYLKGWMLHDLASSNGCKRDGLRITDADLQVGDELQLGKLVYIVEAVDPPALDESIDSESVAIEALETETLTEMEACRLAFFKDGQRIGAVLVVARALIGNADRVEIQLPKEGIDNVHALIYRHDTDWYLHDLNSRTGVTYAGQQVKTLKLESGMVCKLGNYMVDVKSKPYPKEIAQRLAQRRNQQLHTTLKDWAQEQKVAPESLDPSVSPSHLSESFDTPRDPLAETGKLSEKHQQWLLEAREAMNRGNFKLCAKLMRLVCKADPMNHEFRQLLRRAEERAYKNPPNKYPWWRSPLIMYYQLRAIRAIQKGRVEPALDLAERGLMLDPYNVGLNMIQARAFEVAEQGKSVIASLRRANLRDKNNINVLRPMAKLLQLNADYNRAIKIWQQVLKIRPEDREAEQQMRMAMVQKTLKKSNFRGLSLRDEQYELDSQTSWIE